MGPSPHWSEASAERSLGLDGRMRPSLHELIPKRLARLQRELNSFLRFLFAA